MSEGHLLAVGQRYHPDRGRWPEGSDLSLSPLGCELRLFYDHPNAQEVQQVRRGTAEFGLVDDGGPAAVLLYRLGTMPWSDQSFEAWRMPEEQRSVPGEDGGRLLLVIVLVDATTGIIRALRSLTWTPEFSDAIRAMVRRQLATPEDREAALAWIADQYQAHPSSQAFLDTAVARCIGGQ